MRQIFLTGEETDKGAALLGDMSANGAAQGGLRVGMLLKEKIVLFSCL